MAIPPPVGIRADDVVQQDPLGCLPPPKTSARRLGLGDRPMPMPGSRAAASETVDRRMVEGVCAHTDGVQPRAAEFLSIGTRAWRAKLTKRGLRAIATRHDGGEG